MNLNILLLISDNQLQIEIIGITNIWFKIMNRMLISHKLSCPQHSTLILQHNVVSSKSFDTVKPYILNISKELEMLSLELFNGFYTIFRKSQYFRK